MEENNIHTHHEHSHVHRAWKWVAVLFVVFAAFVIGFACGRFSAMFGAYGYGYGRMMGPWMMYGYYPYGEYAAPTGQAVPSNATATPAPYYYYPMGRMMGGYYYPQATSTQ